MAKWLTLSSRTVQKDPIDPLLEPAGVLERYCKIICDTTVIDLRSRDRRRVDEPGNELVMGGSARARSDNEQRGRITC